MTRRTSFVPRRSARILALAGLLLLASGLSGCWYSLVPGSYGRVASRADPAMPRVGRVYLIRGWIGWWSTGMDDIECRLRSLGVDAVVYQELQACTLAKVIANRYRGDPDPEPLVIIGHSNGADVGLTCCRHLDAYGVPVDLLVTVDPSHPHPYVSKNVRRCHNIYARGDFRDFLPPFQYISTAHLEADDPTKTVLTQGNIRCGRYDLWETYLDHFNIEERPQIQREVVAKVLETCVWRTEWDARRTSRAPAATPPR